ncbi:hypothetical protein PoB_004560000 [Plakobranchus ocellatus]|uniref:Uncharacterized protein n=1 Tax=Plakobranchus ocellatus TaxID=259542 RepID=A0AAV4BJ75_9GAST|nr:hypothetical protein PoB_004560000 [Plakobranchus ocellatus]
MWFIRRMMSILSWTEKESNVLVMKVANLERSLIKTIRQGGVGSTVACESALRSAGTLLSRVRAPLPAPWPDGGPESLRSPCCGLAIYKKLKLRGNYSF